ncbi:hypothetical protein [Dysgonomonas sp. 37-18]|uniref:hypothetical protein n=1 Tax=Dysgonomonas sp. 37-18 TaxID=1895907 RepID=UPI00092A6D0E|nr:hypothetical protein [Dysgonomonas sp. 37-18]OJX63101.1 MAG: hypothetical protein BGO84_14450 [Dysgonomonas sp. 37-18]
MEKVKCNWCFCEFDSKDNRFDDYCPVCPKCDDKNKADMDKAMSEFFQYEAECNRKDQRVINAIKTVKGNSFHKSLGDLIEDLDRTSGYSIVDKPKGNYQKEYWHKEIQGVWVDQWCNGGYSGDEFAGDVYVKIKRQNKKDKYLKIPYSM